ncbi:filamentous hemagglutinin N-terminal domain-containing protein [Caballeronia arationis]|uniref:two-partner secretion domain-containing protein n=1 Tax=Caballeronia arationis TaxID=1777142 RepID=UPI0031345234
MLIQPIAVLAFILSAMGADAFAAGLLPRNGQFVAGTGSITTSNNAVNISQNTTRAVIDWRSFSIGSGNSVQVNNGAGATLNRVTGIDRSIIDGKLTASGSLYLINPQGVVVSANGVVTTGGRFVASTLDIGNANFMSGGSLNLSGSSDGVVINLGKISSTGGDVFLISRKLVENDGSISAPNGTAELATGSQVLLKDSASGPQVFVQPGTHGDVINTARSRPRRSTCAQPMATCSRSPAGMRTCARPASRRATARSGSSPIAARHTFIRT